VEHHARRGNQQQVTSNKQSITHNPKTHVKKQNPTTNIFAPNANNANGANK
jgi:hypothetical protein